MIKKRREGISFYEFEIFQDFARHLGHAVFTRSTDICDATSIQKALDCDFPIVSFKNQLHGAQHWFVPPPRFLILPHSSAFPMPLAEGPLEHVGEKNGDVLITQNAGVCLLIRIADCASIILFDPVKKIAANIHAGWRGLSQRVIRDSIKKIKDRFGCRSENILAAVSPMLGPCCNRFTEPKKELPRFMHKYILEENAVDLWAAAVGHLRECGLQENHIEIPRVCTFCNPEEFYSYRRDATDKRFCAVIYMKS